MMLLNLFLKNKDKYDLPVIDVFSRHVASFYLNHFLSTESVFIKKSGLHFNTMILSEIETMIETKKYVSEFSYKGFKIRTIP
jgi:hypothetical protein